MFSNRSVLRGHLKIGFRRLFASGQSPTGKFFGGYLLAATLKSSCIGILAHTLKIHPIEFPEIPFKAGRQRRHQYDDAEGRDVEGVKKRSAAPRRFDRQQCKPYPEQDRPEPVRPYEIKSFQFAFQIHDICHFEKSSGSNEVGGNQFIGRPADAGAGYGAVPASLPDCGGCCVRT